MTVFGHNYKGMGSTPKFGRNLNDLAAYRITSTMRMLLTNPCRLTVGRVVLLQRTNKLPDQRSNQI